MRFLALAALGMLTACTLEQQNGDLRVVPGPLMTGQPWQITQQAKGVCTVSAGEVEVTQRTRGGAIAQQVATANPLDPGDRYKLLIGSHVYETMNNDFDPRQSHQIIQYMLSAPTLYTERSETTIEGRDQLSLKRIPNKIPLDGFARQYNACTQYLRRG